MKVFDNIGLSSWTLNFTYVAIFMDFLSNIEIKLDTTSCLSKMEKCPESWTYFDAFSKEITI